MHEDTDKCHIIAIVTLNFITLLNGLTRWVFWKGRQLCFSFICGGKWWENVSGLDCYWCSKCFRHVVGQRDFLKSFLVVKKALQKLGSSYLKRLDMHVSLQSLCCSLPFCCLPALICGSCLEESESFITGFKHFLLGLCCALICPFTVRAEREQNKYAIILLDELWLTAGNNSKSAKPFSFY